MTAKKRLWLFILGLVAVLGLALVVRAGLPVTARAGTQACVPGPHHGMIYADETWCLAQSPHVLDGDVQVASGATLTIEPGVEVRVLSWYVLKLWAGSGLLAQGSTASPITFTSSAPTPQPGDWYGLTVDTGAHVRLDHVDLAYAGTAGYNGSQAVYLNSSDVEVRNSRIHHSLGDGVAVAQNSVGAVLENVQIDHNTGWAVSQALLDTNPSYHNLTMTDNGAGALVIWNGQVTNRSVTLDGSPAALNGAPVVFASNGYGSPRVMAGNTLTVTAGSELQMPIGPDFQVQASGTLLAEGTADEPITFTSSAQAPQPGDWTGITVYAGAHVRLDHVDLAYAGKYYNRAVYLNASDVEVRNSRIHDSLGDGVVVDQSSVGAVLDGVQIDHNTGWAVSQARLDTNPSYHNLTMTDNGTDALLISNGWVHDRSVTLDGSPAALNGAPVVLASNGYGSPDVDAGKTLTVTAGSELLMPNGGYILVRGSGTLLAEGTADQPITFTSQSPAPAPGQWQEIDVQQQGSARLSYCDIEYAGQYSVSAFYIRSSNVQVSHCLIHDNLNAGIEVVSDAFPQIVYNQIQGNGFGLRNSNSIAWVDARKNYWGDATGPYNATANPGGLGNAVSDHVLFFPWATTPDGTLVAKAGVQVVGPRWASPGQLVDYYLSYYTFEPLQNALLALGVPETSYYEQSDPSGSYLTSARQVYWLLGDLPAGAEGLIKVQAEFLWGLPLHFPDGASAILYSPDLDFAPIDFDPTAYYTYQPILPGGSVVLTPAEIQAELNAYPEMNTLYQQALADGYMLMGGSVETLGGQPYTMLILLNGDQQSMLSLRRDRSGGHAEAHAYAPTSYQASDVNGGTVMDYLSGGVSGYGTWTIPGLQGEAQVSIAPDAPKISAYDCFSNCMLEAVGMWAIQKASKTVDAAMRAKDCILALAGDGGAAEKCFLALKKVAQTAPGCSEIVEVHQCVQDCVWDFNRSKHVCDPSKLIFTVEPSVWMFLNPATWDMFGGAKKVFTKWTCDPKTLRWQKPEILYCPNGEVAQAGATNEYGWPCILVNDLLDANYKGPSTLVRTNVQVAGDPNAKLGPSGAVLPTEVLSYTITYENEGEGTAYGVFILDELPETFDAATLQIGDGGEFSPAMRSISWDIGELAPKGQPGSKGQVSFQVALKAELADGTLIENQAVVYFPSVPEETPTNWVVNEVHSLVAYPQVVEAVSGASKPITLHGADVNGLPLTYQVTDAPLYGTLTGTPPNVVYTPFEAYQGEDGFSFLVDNGTSQSGVAQVEIRVGPSPADTTPPEVIWHSPLSGAQVDLSGSVPISDSLGLAYPPTVLVEFSEPLAAATVNGTTVQLKDASGQGVLATVAYLDGPNQVSLTPREALSNGQYTVSLATGITDLKGNHLAAVSWQFEVVGQGGPSYRLYLPMVLRKYP